MIFFKQILLGNMDNFAYLIGCDKTREAAVVDPAFDVEKIVRLATAEGYQIKTIFTTHGHLDHLSGHNGMVQKTGAKVVAHRLEADRIRENSIPVDLEVEDHDRVKVGEITIKIIHTPGHTPGGICLLIEGKKLVTGDTLFVGDCGRTDLAGGSAQDLYRSIHEKLKVLDDDVEVYPGHDYGDSPSSTIGKERKTNPTMNCKSLEEFQALP